MTVIVVASPKGGVGKTTISILLAEHYAHMGWNVALVESDNQAHVQNYNAAREAKGRNVNFKLYTDENPDTLGGTIKAADAAHDLTIVDLPGFDGQEFTRAVARANLVLIPMAPAPMDNTSASNAMRQLATEEEHLDRKINHRIVLNMVKDANLREKAVAVNQTEKGLRHYIESAGYPRLASELSRKEGPYKAFYTFAQTFQEMAGGSNKSSIENAYTEVCDLAEEILQVLNAPAGQEGVA